MTEEVKLLHVLERRCSGYHPRHAGVDPASNYY